MAATTQMESSQRDSVEGRLRMDVGRGTCMVDIRVEVRFIIRSFPHFENSHSMARPSTSLKPRKMPVQTRSAHTVEAIHTACIQVLIDGGLERLSTTRVAARAGVSVGSLYQYYPNKQSLLAAVLEQHLLHVVEAVEAACRGAKGQPVAAMAAALVQAFITAKFAEPAASRALYAVASEVQGEAVVARLTQRSQVALCDMLVTAADQRFADLTTISFVLSTSVVGPVQGLLVSSASAPVIERVQGHLIAMVSAYLDEMGTVFGTSTVPRRPHVLFKP
jgi:AcrR family transcriptional regulator